MELKHLVKMFTYHIEAKPVGGFIAHANDPSLPPLEAPTRMELQEKIQANINAAISQQFPSLRIPAENKELKFDFHIEAKPGGGFVLHSHNPNAGPNSAPIEGSTHEDIEFPFAEKLIGVMGKYLAPELTKALAAQGSGDIKLFVNQKVGFTASAGSHKLTFGTSPSSDPQAPQLSSGAENALGMENGVGIENAASSENALGLATTNFQPSASTPCLDAQPGAIIFDANNNSPITPVANKSWPVLRFLLTMLIIAAIMYFYLHR